VIRVSEETCGFQVVENMLIASEFFAITPSE